MKENLKILQLYRGGKEMLANDGIMYTDKTTTPGMIEDVKARNNSYRKNFPHKVADEFAVYHGRIGTELGKRIKITE